MHKKNLKIKYLKNMVYMSETYFSFYYNRENLQKNFNKGHN